MNEITQLVQALGAPFVMILIWMKWNRDQHRNGGNGKPSLEPALREIVGEMRAITAAFEASRESMAVQARVLENVAERLIDHTTASAPAIAAIAEVRSGVAKLVNDMEAGHRHRRHGE
jgi:hypothetical protein